MMIKTWHWALVAVGITLCILIVATGPGANSVTNVFFIPAGTFEIFPDLNGTPGKEREVFFSPDYYKDPINQKLMDAMVSIKEWNISSPNRYNRNITIIHISDKDFNEYPELKRVMLDVKDEPLRNVSGQSLSVAYFPANLSDYYHWLLDSICKDKTRLECYDDFPVFEYHGRHYDIGVAFF